MNNTDKSYKHKAEQKEVRYERVHSDSIYIKFTNTKTNL